MFPTFEMLNLYVHQEKKCWITLTALIFLCLRWVVILYLVVISPS